MPRILFFTVIFGFVFAVSSLRGADEFPKIPTEINLVGGQVMRGVVVQTWAKDRIVVKYLGGAASVQFIHMAPDSRKGFEAARDVMLARQPTPSATPAPQSTAPIILQGQAFIVTQGAGSYKLGAMTVYAFPLSVYRDDKPLVEWDLGKPISKALTDADGKFSLTISPQTGYFLFAQSSRLAGSFREYYLWRIKAADIIDRSAVLLSSKNNENMNLSVRIDE